MESKSAQRLPGDFVPFKNGRSDSEPQAILTGFLSSEGKAYGHPLGVARVLAADDVGNTLWRVTPITPQ